ncbi:hypothetical protein JCM18899A_47180 [Nocardioides sp. AN3]
MSEDQTYEGSASDRTGVPAVDAVVDEVDRVAELPVEEHVAVFERAHEELRRALDHQADDSPESF